MAQYLPKRRAGEDAGPISTVSYRYLTPRDEGRHAEGRGDEEPEGSIG